jgi:hypothetical protein
MGASANGAKRQPQNRHGVPNQRNSLQVLDQEHAVFISVLAIQATEERNPPAQRVSQYQILEKLFAVIDVRRRATYASSESWLTALRAAILKSS